ncbi:unnamed protein product [Protopolystoma xenopodis]|uniref:G-protein coupled receptors family 1 profile domain-containing protein n=1 Tax=Protopolystoma xenopodis TaxID=117903 RepID=A0A448XMH2_9PLAT|nr:unnamed protein product [Protopolystoma xenopodis]
MMQDLPPAIWYACIILAILLLALGTVGNILFLFTIFYKSQLKSRAGSVKSTRMPYASLTLWPKRKASLPTGYHPQVTEGLWSYKGFQGRQNPLSCLLVATSDRLLSLMTFTDCLAQWTTLPRYLLLILTEVDLRTLHPCICWMHTFVVMTTTNLSVAYLCIFSVHRAIRLRWPLWSRRKLTQARLQFAIVLATGLCIAKHLPVFFLFRVVPNNRINSSSPSSPCPTCSSSSSSVAAALFRAAINATSLPVKESFACDLYCTNSTSVCLGWFYYGLEFFTHGLLAYFCILPATCLLCQALRHSASRAPKRAGTLCLLPTHLPQSTDSRSMSIYQPSGSLLNREVRHHVSMSSLQELQSPSVDGIRFHCSAPNWASGRAVPFQPQPRQPISAYVISALGIYHMLSSLPFLVLIEARFQFKLKILPEASHALVYFPLVLLLYSNNAINYYAMLLIGPRFRRQTCEALQHLLPFCLTDRQSNVNAKWKASPDPANYSGNNRRSDVFAASRQGANKLDCFGLCQRSHSRAHIKLGKPASSSVMCGSLASDVDFIASQDQKYAQQEVNQAANLPENLKERTLSHSLSTVNLSSTCY